MEEKNNDNDNDSEVIWFSEWARMEPLKFKHLLSRIGMRAKWLSGEPCGEGTNAMDFLLLSESVNALGTAAGGRFDFYVKKSMLGATVRKLVAAVVSWTGGDHASNLLSMNDLDYGDEIPNILFEWSHGNDGDLLYPKYETKEGD